MPEIRNRGNMYDFFRNLFRKNRISEETCLESEKMHSQEQVQNLKRENYLKAEESFIKKTPFSGTFPLHAYLEVSKCCNLNCIMCPGHHFSKIKISREEGIMSREIFETLRDFFPYLLRADLSGDGEPLLNKDLLYFVEQLKRYYVFVSFITNGLLLGKKESKFLLDNDLDQVIFSIDSSKEEHYTALRPGSDFKVVAGNLSYISEKRVSMNKDLFISVNAVLMKDNEDDLEDLINFVSDAGVNQLIINPLLWYPDEQYQKFYNEHKSSLTESADSRERIQELFSIAKARCIDLQLRFFSTTLSSGETSRVCAEPRTTIYITSSGDFKSCCLNEITYGNLRDESAAAIWFGDGFQELRNQLTFNTSLNKFCKNCINNNRSDNFFNSWKV